MNKQDVATMAPHIQRAKDMNYAPRDSPLLHGGGGMRTPGVAQLREAFDITYAVHRMEEEGARRVRYGGAGAGPNAGVLHGLNEEDEDEDATVDEAGRPSAKTDKSQQQHYQGWGGADRKVAEAALYSGQAGTRDRGTTTARGGKRAGGFELNIGQATLLGRRNKAV